MWQYSVLYEYNFQYYTGALWKNHAYLNVCDIDIHMTHLCCSCFAFCIAHVYANKMQDLISTRKFVF